MKAYQCPVCSMAVTDSRITSTRHGKIYHFCSQQCLENFSARPRLYLASKTQEHKRARVLKKRVFMLDAPVAQEDVPSLELFLSEMMGVHLVHVSAAKVSIVYDLLEATALQIEQAIEQQGTKLGESWVRRLKRGWVHYTEETELDNLDALDPACCNKAPAKH